MIGDEEVEDFLSHFGVKGQKWGIRRNKRTGVRPIARTLDKSKFGQLANRNVKKHNARAEKRRAKSGGPKKGFHRDGTMSTAEKTATIAAGGAAAFVILQRVGLRILL